MELSLSRFSGVGEAVNIQQHSEVLVVEARLEASTMNGTTNLKGRSVLLLYVHKVLEVKRRGYEVFESREVDSLHLCVFGVGYVID